MLLYVFGLFILAAAHGWMLKVAADHTGLRVPFADAAERAIPKNSATLPPVETESELRPVTFEKAFSVAFALLLCNTMFVYSIKTSYKDLHGYQAYGAFAATVLLVSFVVLSMGLGVGPRTCIRVAGVYAAIVFWTHGLLAAIGWVLWQYS